MKACFAFFFLLSLSNGDDGPKRDLHRHLQTTLQPKFYSMRNGYTLNSIKLWDEEYNNFPPTHDGDYLFGGVGKLTDGVKATASIDTNPELYVGWKTSSVPIYFHFERKSIIENVKISIDDSKDEGVCRPKKVRIGRTDYVFPGNPDAGPYEADIALTSPVISSYVKVILFPFSKECTWIAVSEIEFGQNNHKIQVKPVRYEMSNGGERNDMGMTFWDDKYSPAPTESYEYLSGNVGDLTDGVKAEECWNIEPTPYVGWEESEYPHIIFFFEDFIYIDEVRISLDNFGPVCPPENIILFKTAFGFIEYDFPEKNVVGPFEEVIELNDNQKSDQLHLVLESDPLNYNQCEWVMISEVEFFARDSDRDGIPDGIDACPHTFEDDIVCEVQGRYIWDGTDWITKDESGKIVPAKHYDMKTLRGCSCEQILDILGPCEKRDCSRKGCTEDKLDEWMDCEPPTMSPTPLPSNTPTQYPTDHPSGKPSFTPTKYPTDHPSSKPSFTPTKYPTDHPSSKPSFTPTKYPTDHPSSKPSFTPTKYPTSVPTGNPSSSPTYAPSDAPTNSPSEIPTDSPTNNPSVVPTNSPTQKPTN